MEIKIDRCGDFTATNSEDTNNTLDVYEACDGLYITTYSAELDAYCMSHPAIKLERQGVEALISYLQAYLDKE